MTKPVVFVFTRAPQYGAVKTRLARDIGPLEATRFHRQTLATLLRRLRHDGRFDVVLATTPLRALRDKGCWPPRSTLVDQGRGDLGRRMLSVLKRANHRPALLIGSDIPEARAWHLVEALRLLGRGDFVLGPVHDGGYWLIGARHPRLLHPDLLAGVRWSSPHALADTVDALSRRGHVELLRDALSDVDDGASLGRLRGSERTKSAAPRF